jgi:hypothetical protein
VRRILLAGSVLAAAVALSGCVVFKGPITGSQLDLIGKARVLFTICASGDPADGSPQTHPGCEDTGNSGDISDGGDYQVFLGFRVPAGTRGPATFANASGEALTFRPSPTYTQQLTSLVPPPPGFEWLGYISDPFTHDPGADGDPAKESSFAVDFDLPPQPAGTPFAGPFKIRPVVGGREADPMDPASYNRPVSCGDNVFGGMGGPFSPSVNCIDSPSEADTATNIEIPTRDLALSGTAANGEPGAIASVPFSANYAGTADPGASFSLTAATNLPGATATPAPATLVPPADSTTPVAVSVPVPAGTPAGSYDVALEARLGNGQTRIAFAKLNIPDRIDPLATSLKVTPNVFTPFPDTSSIAAARGTRVSYALDEAATVRFTVRRRKGGRFKRLMGSFKHSGTAGTNSFRFTGFLRKRPLRVGRYRLVGVPTDLAGNRGSSVRAKFRIAP